MSDADHEVRWAQYCADVERRWREAMRVPDPEEVKAAEHRLGMDKWRCGRCAWLCQNPHPNMYERQVVSHDKRHTELEALSDDQLIHRYVMSEIVVNEFDNRIGYAELTKRGYDTAKIPRPRYSMLGWC
ncbi:hypothetical protein [Actinomadura hibisca]|uniref:hypothetical protein n=1 Tax=Actinomadura hibisca TaxID=68565 RepID=UPI0012F9585C|nr:hypothetical protein [Actinomadura hibisca]